MRTDRRRTIAAARAALNLLLDATADLDEVALVTIIGDTRDALYELQRRQRIAEAKPIGRQITTCPAHGHQG